MNETHMRELMELEQRKVEIERQKLAIQFAAIEVAIDDKIQLHAEKFADKVSGVVAAAVTELKKDNLELRYVLNNTRAELKADIASVRTELKADIRRLEEKIDSHAH